MASRRMNKTSHERIRTRAAAVVAAFCKERKKERRKERNAFVIKRLNLLIRGIRLSSRTSKGIIPYFYPFRLISFQRTKSSWPKRRRDGTVTP